MQEAIRNWIQQYIGEGDFVVEYPTSLDYGDYAINLALVNAKNEGKNPRELAEIYLEKLQENLLPEIEKIEIAGPGFINVFLKRDFFVQTVGEVLDKKGEFGKNDSVKEKISYEYTNTNVLKPMHIGHLMGNVIGESLSRLAEWNGAEVVRNTYQGDVGLHIAKTIWGIRNSEGIVAGKNLSEEVAYIGDAYTKGSEVYEESEEAQKEIKDINKKVYEGNDSEINTIKEWAKDISLRHFRELYKILGTEFDGELFESEVAEGAVKVVEEFKAKGIFEESDGAIVFNAEKYNEALHTRVFITSQGVPTYEAKDIAHAIRKYELYNFDTSFIITANEQNEYFKVVLTALGQIRPDIAEKTKHLSHGMLKLTTGKMSSRKGNVITGESLINEAIDSVRKIVAENKGEEQISEEDTEKIGVAAIKYSILKQAPGKDIIFDIEKSISFEGDSGPYLQYTAVRTKSIEEKAREAGVEAKAENPTDLKLYEVERVLHRFPEVINHAYAELAPQTVVTYLIELASAFNHFYAEEKIVDTKDVDSSYKLALSQAVGQVLVNGLNVLGMSIPQKM